MTKERGLRSSNDAKPWRCQCGKLNQPTEHRFFDLPAFRCRRCGTKFDHNFKFCLGEIEVDGGSLIGEVMDQANTGKCVAFAYCKTIEILERVCNVNNQQDPNNVIRVDPHELHHRFETKFPNFVAADIRSKTLGIHKCVHMGLILRDDGIQREEGSDIYKAEDLCTIARDDFEEISRCLAAGIPLVATYHAGKRRGKLRYCQIYKSPSRKEVQKYRGHAVVLIGAGMRKGRRRVGRKRRRRTIRFFYFLNSWGDKFAPRKNIHGEIIMGGIGKIRAEDLTKNVIRLTKPHKKDACWRLNAESDSGISRDNYFMMLSLKQYYGEHVPMVNTVELQGNAKRTKATEQLSDEIDEMLEDHLIHGPFYDDEAGCFQSAEDWDNELEDSFREMEGPLSEDLCNTLHYAQSAGAPVQTSNQDSGSPSNGPATARPLDLFGTGFSELDQTQEQLTQLLGINPNAHNRVELNTWSMEMLKNSEFLCQMIFPNTLQKLLSFKQTQSYQLGHHQQNGNNRSYCTGTQGSISFAKSGLVLEVA